MEFLNIETLATAFKYATKIKENFKQKGKRDYFSNNKPRGEGNNKFGGKLERKDPPSNPSKNTWWATKKIQTNVGMWCEIHKPPIHNTKECPNIKNLMIEIHRDEFDPESTPI